MLEPCAWPGLFGKAPSPSGSSTPRRAAYRGPRLAAALPPAARRGQVVAGEVRAHLRARGKAGALGELVKDYEYAKGKFIVLTQEDFKEAALEKSRTIDIRAFIKPDDIDDRFFESSYYLVAPKGSERAYALLREAIGDTGLVGIAAIVWRDSQHLAALQAVDKALALTLMRYAEELVDISTCSFPAAKDVREPELEMARTLVKHLEDTWDPSRFKDEYRANLMRIIKARMRGKTVRLEAHEEPQKAEVVHLMERLRQSLAGTAASRKTAKPAKSRRSRTTRGRTTAAKKRRAA